ncbi:MAG: hypothetical protein FJ291_16245 [Planctomycetes bacterium]|nr:hypothetical protein [Planctomycetota bacterium]
MKRALCLVAWLAPLAICLSTCIQPRQMPEALDPALVEAEIIKAKGGDLAKVEPEKEPVIAMAEPPKEPAAPKPTPPKEPVAPKPEPPKEPIPPRPEPPKEPTPPKPEPPKEPTPPKPEPPKEPVPPKPEPPKEPKPPKPEPPKEPTPPKPEPPKEPTPPKPEPPKEPTPPKPVPPKEPVPPKPEPPKPEPPKEPVAPKPEPPKEPVVPKPEPPKPEPPKEPVPPKPEPPKPEPPKEPVAPKPEPPKEPVVPKPEPPKEPVPPKPQRAAGPFLFSPVQRTCFAAGETAEYTVVLVSEADIPNAAVTLSVANEAGETWTTTDSLGLLPAGRYSMAYGVDVSCFPEGAYKVSARFGEQAAPPLDLVVAAQAPRTHFPLAGWVGKAPKWDLDAQRWARFLGLNTVLLEGRSPRGAESTLVMDEAFSATSRGMRAAPDSRPMEVGLAIPPFIQVADRLTAAGLNWLDANAVSSEDQNPLMPERDLANPLTVRGALHRIHQTLQAERRFRRFAGLLLTDEALLPRAHVGDATTPFGLAGHLAAYQKRSEAKEQVPWQKGSESWDQWYPYVLFRAGILGEALGEWAAAARAVRSDAVVTSLLHSPTLLADGAYPPLAAEGLPIITTTAPLNGPAGMMMPAVVADLQRAGNRGRPLWFMPEVSNEADLDEIRAAIFLALARKIDGVVYPKNVDYHLDRPAIGAGATDVQASIGGINDLLTRLGDFFLALERPADDVAILYSATEHIERMGRDPLKDPDAPSYPWTLIGAYNACLFAHFPATFLTEEELLGAAKLKSKVILAIGLNRVRPEVKAALERHIAAGGVVLTDTTTKAEIEGARPLGVEFPDIYRHFQNPPLGEGEQKTTPELERRDVAIQIRLLYPLLGPLRTELRQHIERDYTTADPDVVACDQRCGAGRYIFLVNNTQQVGFTRGLKWELAAGQSRVTFREGNYAVYEAVEGKRVFPIRDKGHPSLALILPPGALRVYALLPEAIRGVRISRASLGRDGLSIAACVHGEARSFLGAVKPINAAVPIELVVKDPAGRERLRVCRAHTPDGYKETLPFQCAAQSGSWTLTVRELLSGQMATATFRVSGGSQAWASRRGPLAAFDGERVTALLRSTQPLTIIVGTDEEAAKAETLAAALRLNQREVEVRLAAELAKPRPLSKDEAVAYVSAEPNNAPLPNIRQPAILLGEAATHPLIQRVHNAGVLPRTVTPDYPGPGGALLCCVVSAFEPGVPAVVAAAADAAGVDRAIEALAAAARGTVPQLAWRSLPASRAVASAAKPPRAPASPQQLAPAWTFKGSDLPTCAAVPLQGTDVTVGFFDGTVFSFNSTGKETWRRRCTTRTRAVARSLDGVWAAIASFPELMLLSAQGRLQFGVPLEQPALRADFTATALTPDGTLTLGGTRAGEVIAYDLQGNKVFTLGGTPAEAPKEATKEGAKEPEKPKEAAKESTKEPEKPKEEKAPEPRKPSGLGCVNAIAIAPKDSTILIGAELGTLALDPKGQEVWASADLNRVTSIAPSYGEEQTVAIGTRTGLVACVTGGTVLWRNQADSYVTAVCFRGQTQEIVAASLDGTLTCYDKNGKALWTRRSPVGFAHVASSLDGTLIAAAELTGRALLLNKAGQPVAETQPVQGIIRAFAFSPDGERIILGTSTGEVLAFKYRRATSEQDEL